MVSVFLAHPVQLLLHSGVVCYKNWGWEKHCSFLTDRDKCLQRKSWVLKSLLLDLNSPKICNYGQKILDKKKNLWQAKIASQSTMTPLYCCWINYFFQIHQNDTQNELTEHQYASYTAHLHSFGFADQTWPETILMHFDANIIVKVNMNFPAHQLWGLMFQLRVEYTAVHIKRNQQRLLIYTIW